MICQKCKKQIPNNSLFCNLCGYKQDASGRAPKSRGNGEGSVYKRNRKWAASITKYHNGQRITKTKSGFAHKGDAIKWISEVQHSRVRATTTLDALYEVYSTSAMEKLSDSKQTAYKIAWGRLKKLAACPVADIVIGDLQGAVSGLSYYPARDIKTLLSHLYKRACAQGDVQANLANFITLPDLNETETEAYTKDELAKFWTEYQDGNDFAGYILLMVYSGMMPGELFKCKKFMIDTKSQTITGCGIKTKERKSRPIVFPNFITPVLERIMQSDSEKLVTVNRDNFYKTYHELQKKIGVRDLKPYSCRHTTATALALGDAAAPSIIARVMRQTRPITTQRYSHADLKTVRDVIDGMGENPLTQTPKP